MISRAIAKADSAHPLGSGVVTIVLGLLRMPSLSCYCKHASTGIMISGYNYRDREYVRNFFTIILYIFAIHDQQIKFNQKFYFHWTHCGMIMSVILIILDLASNICAKTCGFIILLWFVHVHRKIIFEKKCGFNFAINIASTARGFFYN